MAQQSTVSNPFMLMIEPEVVLAAIENSERLGRLNSRLCRPLDRPQVPGKSAAAEGADSAADDDDTDTDTTN